MGGRFFHDVINHNTWLSDSMAAVFIYLRSLAVGAEYEIFLVVERTLLTLCSTV